MLLPRTIFLAACAIAILRIHSASPPDIPTASTNFPGWPIALDGIPLDPLPLSLSDQRFAANFPGETASFHCGDHRVILRWLDRPTRQLHPPSDCLRALGYSIESKPVTVDPDGRHWGTIKATKPGATLTVRTRIYDPDGQSWTDASSWFWSAASGKSPGPWWAVTIFESTS